MRPLVQPWRPCKLIGRRGPHLHKNREQKDHAKAFGDSQPWPGACGGRVRVGKSRVKREGLLGSEERKARGLRMRKSNHKQLLGSVCRRFALPTSASMLLAGPEVLCLVCFVPKIFGGLGFLGGGELFLHVQTRGSGRPTFSLTPPECHPNSTPMRLYEGRLLYIASCCLASSGRLYNVFWPAHAAFLHTAASWGHAHGAETRRQSAM